MVSQPHLKKRTADYYTEICKILRETLPLDLPARSWTALEAARWWKTTAGKYSAQRANNVLALVKRMASTLAEAGTIADDPTEKLGRVRIEARNHQIPSRATVEAVITDIRGRKKANCKEAANFVAFLAFAGCRVGQARGLQWEDFHDNWITFAGGVEGSKGSATRRLPINPSHNPVSRRKLSLLVFQSLGAGQDHNRTLLREIFENSSVKMQDRLRALELDAKLAGQFEPDRVEIEGGTKTLLSIKESAAQLANALGRQYAFPDEGRPVTKRPRLDRRLHRDSVCFQGRDLAEARTLLKIALGMDPLPAKGLPRPRSGARQFASLAADSVILT